MKAPLKLLLFVCTLLYYGSTSAQTTETASLKAYLDKNRSQLNLNQEDYADLKITHSYSEKGSDIQRIYAQQKINGIDVVGGSFSLHTNTKSKFEVGTNNLLPVHAYQKDGSFPYRTPEFAAKKSLETIGADQHSIQLKQAEAGADKKTIYKRSNIALWDVPVRLVYLADDKAKKLKLAWEVQVYEYNKQHYWVMYIEDQSGKVVKKVDLVLHCQFDGAPTDAKDHKEHKHDFAVNKIIDEPAPPLSPFMRSINATNNKYRVYDLPIEAPTDPIATHSLVQDKEDPTASPDGWHKVANAVTHNYTRGNNVYAFYDPSPGPLGGAPNPATAAQSNGGAGGTPNLSEPFTFDYPVNLTQQPASYRNAAIVNLFYWNNLIHDVYYQYGFTEDAGNFQASHIFSTGQRGSNAAAQNGQNDEVWAQAQDGGGVNNANMLTLQDGINGQMQMYLWQPSRPDSLVQIRSSSTGVPPAGTKYFAKQGSFSTISPKNLHTDSVSNRQFVIVRKNAISIVGDSTQGCSTGQQGIALPPSNDVTGKIVLIDRGGCTFAEKVFGAQLGGAAGVIVINNVDGPPITMGGSDATTNLINIPAVMVSKADGDFLKAQIRNGATIFGSLRQDEPLPPMRDGDFDNAVIAHEYGHGISNRLTGGRNALLPLGGQEQGGEGWSDFIGLHMITRTNDLLPATPQHPNGILPNKGIGTYVTYQDINTGGGIRPTPYSIDKSVNPYMFKDIAKGGEITVPHGVGYIWCTMLYEMEQRLIDQYGFNDNIYNPANPDASGAPAAGSGGNNIAMRLVIEGMKIQPISPTFEQQRNAILKADTLLYGGRHSCTIWRAFAKRGLGFSARSGSNQLGDELQAIDLPQACAPNQVRMNIRITGPAKTDNNSIANYTINVRNANASAVPNVIVEHTLPAGTSLMAASDGGMQVGNKVVWNLPSIDANAVKQLMVQLSLNLSNASEGLLIDDHETTSKFTSDMLPDSWQLVARDAFSGTKTWYAKEVENPVHNVTLTQTVQLAIPPQGAKLSFFHKFNTEKEFDGGVIEISKDNGVNWTYLPATAFEKNGYNSIIATADNPMIGTANLAAFSGATNGYINSIASLSQYAGQQIKVRFRYTCDVASLASGANPGWYVDDIYILKNLTAITNYTSLSLASGSENLFDSTGNAPVDSVYTLVLENSPLPTSLSNLNAAAQSNHIRLSWKTFTEINNAGFEIERKAEDEANYRTVGFVKGAGNTNQEKTYIYNDADVRPGVYYHYRLRQKDTDGKNRLSNVAIAKLGAKDNQIVLDIMPNPATTNANLVVSTPGRKTGIVRIFDAMGKPVATFNAASAFNGVQRYEVNIATLPAGTYWVELVVDEVKMTKQLIVNR